MCPVLSSQTPARTSFVRRSPAARGAAHHPAEMDGLLRELAYVFRLTERVREAVTAGEALLAVGA